MGNHCKRFFPAGHHFYGHIFLEFQRLFYLTLAIFIWFLKTHIYFCIWVYQALVEAYKLLVEAYKLLAAACWISFLNQGLNLGPPALGAQSFKPLDHRVRPYIIYFNITAFIMFLSILEIVGSAKLIREFNSHSEEKQFLSLASQFPK